MTNMSKSRIIVAALLIASAVVFAIGVSVERSQAEQHSDAPAGGQSLGNATLAPEGSAAREGAEKTIAATKAVATSAPEGSAAREAAEKKPSATAAKPLTTAAPEGSAAREAAEGGGSSGASGERAEKLFGIRTESTGLVIAVVVLSLILAAGMLIVRSPLILVAAAVVVLGATAFDIRELAHQIDESRNGVAVLAGLTGVLHIAVAAVAAGLLFVERPRRGA